MRRQSPRNREVQRLQKRGAEKEGLKKSKVNYSFPDDRTYDEPHKRSWEPKKYPLNSIWLRLIQMKHYDKANFLFLLTKGAQPHKTLKSEGQNRLSYVTIVTCLAQSPITSISGSSHGGKKYEIP
jgi:hypothetical protein